MDRGYNVSDVRTEFEHEFTIYHKTMACSACLMSAGRLSQELDGQNSTNSSDQLEAVKAFLEVQNRTCEYLPNPLVGVPGDKGPEFKSFEEVEKEDPALAKKALQNSERARVMVTRMCTALMFDTQEALFDEVWVPGFPVRSRWRRWLCAEKHRVCKRKETGDDEDEEEAGDSVTSVDVKRREARMQRPDDVLKLGMERLLGRNWDQDEPEELENDPDLNPEDDTEKVEL